jgi:hypothetical protein
MRKLSKKDRLKKTEAFLANKPKSLIDPNKIRLGLLKPEKGQND